MTTNCFSFTSMKLRLLAKARVLTAFIASICRYASPNLRSAPALLAVFGAVFACVAPAQTAHLSAAQVYITGGLSWPQEVAVDGTGDIYVADADNGRVLKLTPSVTGYIQSTIGTGLKNPYGVAVDASGNVYIADIFLTTLLKETPNGSGGYTQTTIGSGLYDAVSVAVDTQGNVYGVEISNSFIGTIFKETLSGGVYTQSSIPAPGTHGVESIAVDASGNLFVNDGWDGRVYEMSPTGGGDYLATQIFSSAGSVALDSKGNLYIAGYPGYVYVLTPQSGGGFTENQIPVNATYTPDGYFDAAGIAVDGKGNIFFDDLYTDVLIELSPSNGNFGPVPVGNTDGPVSMFFTFDSGGELGSTPVVTLGSASPLLDFANATTGTCYTANFYDENDTCYVDVDFTPSAAGTRYGAVVLENGAGAPFATGYVEGIGVAPQVNFSPGTQIAESIASDGSAVAVDALGNLYTVTPGAATAFMDTPAGGPSSWTEVPIGSGFGSASGIAIDGAGNLYIADQQNQQVVEETLTASGYTQSVLASGLNAPSGVASDAAGNVYVSDAGANQVFEETPSAAGYIQTALPTSALSQPSGVAVDGTGAVYIADKLNNRVLKETPIGSSYSESTIGSGLSAPTAVAVDGFGNVYISETAAHKVFKETLAAGSYAQSTIASGIQPYGVAVDGNGNLYVAGSLSQLLTKVDVTDGPALNFASTPVGSVSSDSPRTVTLENVGNATLHIPVLTGSYAGDNNPFTGGSFSLDSDGPSTCPVVTPSATQPGTLAAGASCLLPISFAPVGTGFQSSFLTIWDDNLNLSPTSTSQSLSLNGTGTPQATQAAELVSPVPGSTLGGSAAFSWSAGSGATLYEFRLGTTGPGSSDLYNSAKATTTALSSGTIGTIPSNGATLYARIYSWINSAWEYNDYTYLESGTPTPATLTSPVPNVGTQLGTNPTFTWSGGAGVTYYLLKLGINGVGSSDLYNSGNLPGTATGVAVPGLPSNGDIVYARLYSYIKGVWQSSDYTYLESGTAIPGALTSPAPNVGTVLGTNPTFTWSGGVGVRNYQLRLGINGVGSSDLHNSGDLPGTATGVAVPGLPSNGDIVYARLYSYINGVWQYKDYTYLESGTAIPGALTSPAPNVGTVLGTNPTFTWSGGVGVRNYQLRLGTTGVGSSDLYNSGDLPGTASGTSVTGLPSNGATVYARLYSYINGVWQYKDYTYLESGTPAPATLTSPVPDVGTQLGANPTFTWSGGVGVTFYQLRLGTTGVGSSDLYNSGDLPYTASGTSATGLPSNGATVYARLYSFIDGAWQHKDYTYKESN